MWGKCLNGEEGTYNTQEKGTRNEQRWGRGREICEEWAHNTQERVAEKGRYMYMWGKR